MTPTLSIIIPVYNERNTSEPMLSRVAAVDIHKEIILVDDGATDDTRDILQRNAAQ